MAFRVLILLAVFLWIDRSFLCIAASKKPEHKKGTMMDVYTKSVGQSKEDMKKFIEDKLTEQQTFGYVKPYVPIVQQPVVRKVWIPDHKSVQDPDILVAGHWTYVMVEGPKWFIDSNKEQEEEKSMIPLEPKVQVQDEKR